MVGVTAANAKQRGRALRLVVDVTGAGETAASDALAQAHGNAKIAILMLRCRLSTVDAEARLSAARGDLAAALGGTEHAPVERLREAIRHVQALLHVVHERAELEAHAEEHDLPARLAQECEHALLAEAVLVADREEGLLPAVGHAALHGHREERVGGAPHAVAPPEALSERAHGRGRPVEVEVLAAAEAVRERRHRQDAGRDRRREGVDDGVRLVPGGGALDP